MRRAYHTLLIVVYDGEEEYLYDELCDEKRVFEQLAKGLHCDFVVTIQLLLPPQTTLKNLVHLYYILSKYSDTFYFFPDLLKQSENDPEFISLLTF